MRKLLSVFYIILVVGSVTANEVVKCGADRINVYMPLLQGKRIGVVAHKASYIYSDVLDESEKSNYNIKENVHLVDFLVSQGINIECVFAPEHGFRGTEDAGEKVNSEVDEETGIMIKSLYNGNAGYPEDEIVSTLDVIVFDLQDVGLRFYTYLTTMVKIMESCAKNNVDMILLDRPNPNGHYVDGPILDMQYKSAVGYLPIPIVHGMTLGEIANMINGENWLPDSLECNITIIKCEGYSHNTLYKLPIAPSPNLPNMRSVYLYPSLCYFEATPISLGRGTDFPFQCYGHPNMYGYEFSFMPKSCIGAKNPPQMNLTCYGKDLREKPNVEYIFERGVDLSYLIDAYKNMHIGDHFFRPFFEKLIGVNWVRKMIEDGKSSDEIKEKWRNDVSEFKQIRAKYLIYEDSNTYYMIEK